MNKFLLIRWGYETIFIIAALAILAAGLLAYRLLLSIANANQDNFANLKPVNAWEEA